MRAWGDDIAVLHSRLPAGDRTRYWRALHAGTLRIAVGARSALFAPVDNLGLVIVDEEHDGSYKQEEGFRYHARDMAQLRAKLAGAVCVLGSATPALETFERARSGKIKLLSLNERANRKGLPKVEVVDLRGYAAPRHAGTPILFTTVARGTHTNIRGGAASDTISKSSRFCALVTLRGVWRS